MPQLRSVPHGPRALVVPLALFLALALVPGASAATSPTITKVSPLKVEVGQTMTINGTGFLPGKNRNIVVFKRDGKPAIFAKADSATKTQITLKVPVKVIPFLVGNDGTQGARRFRLRILAKRFGNAFTATKLSPQIGAPGAFGGSPDSSAAADCDKDGTPNSKDLDDDNDGLPDTLEKTYGTDPCKVDTDGDGVSDLFETESAIDLNSRAVPYPGKKPYPNPLDGSDANIDFDQDGLTMLQEYTLWMYTGGKLPLTYSDGDQDTNPNGSSTPVTPETAALDLNHNGVLTDDEKDADNDGLTNYDETTGRMTIKWWAAEYPSEAQYVGADGASPLGETSYVDPDTDGDGIPDGAGRSGSRRLVKPRRARSLTRTSAAACTTGSTRTTRACPTGCRRRAPSTRRSTAPGPRSERAARCPATRRCSGPRRPPVPRRSARSPSSLGPFTESDGRRTGGRRRFTAPGRRPPAHALGRAWTPGRASCRSMRSPKSSGAAAGRGAGAGRSGRRGRDAHPRARRARGGAPRSRLPARRSWRASPSGRSGSARSTPLLRDPDVDEIMVYGTRPVWVERGGRLAADRRRVRLRGGPAQRDRAHPRARWAAASTRPSRSATRGCPTARA